MKNKEIEQAEKELSEIEKMERVAVGKPLVEFSEKYGIHRVEKRGLTSTEWIEQTFKNGHTFLQTKMMLNACTTARSSCKWAAIAATVAAIGVVAGWYTHLFKTIMLMFKSTL